MRNAFVSGWVVLAVMLAFGSMSHAREPEQNRLFELRTYYAHEGKIDALQARFRDHTLALFDKHGMTNLAYWVPRQGGGGTLMYLLSYPDRAARDASWKAFFSDAGWKAAYAASTADGKLVRKVESVFLTTTSWSPEVDLTNGGSSPRLFELRRYTTNQGKLDDLHARFRDHTVELFAGHGMTNLWYFEIQPSGKEDLYPAETTLLYFLAHEDEKSRDASFDSFRDDPAWKAARAASEVEGPILIKGGVESILLEPTDYSPLQ